MSRDDKANYYDLELPDGTVVEAQDVTRALLERAALPPYASKCLGTLLERVWRFGAKPGTDTARESEKVVTEASFLCEALGGVPSFTMRDVARAAHDAGIEIKFSCDDPAARIAELEREMQAFRNTAGLALREEARVARRTRNEMLAELDGKKRIIRETLQENANLRRGLAAEREAHEATRRELEHERERTAALRAEVTSLGKTYDAEMDFRAEMRRELGADDSEGFDQFLRRVHRELVDLRDRYRPRRQSEEPAPEDEVVLVRGCRGKSWTAIRGAHVGASAWWCRQPPAPSEEGE